MVDPNQQNSLSIKEEGTFLNHTSAPESDLEANKPQTKPQQQLLPRTDKAPTPTQLNTYPQELTLVRQSGKEATGQVDLENSEKARLLSVLQTKLEQLENEKKTLISENEILAARVNDLEQPEQPQPHPTLTAISKGGILNSHNLTATTTRRLFSSLKRRFTPISANIDTPLAHTLTKSTFLVVEGWAYSTAGSITEIKVYLDEALLGSASQNIARSDVAGFFRVAGMVNSGFKGNFALEPFEHYGSKNLRVVIFDSAGNSQELTHSITLEKPAVEMTLDEPVTGTLTAGVVIVSGWAFSWEAPISTIQVLRAGQLIGTVSYGTSRPDIVEKKDRPSNVERPGFWGTINLPPNLARKDILTIRAVDALGNLAEDSVEIKFVVADEPAAEIERVKWQGNLLHLEGYALWPESQAPRRVRLFVNGKFVGQVSLNLARPDIQSRFPTNPLALRSGFQIDLSLNPSKKEAWQDLHEITVEFVDGGGRHFQQKCHVQYEPRFSLLPNSGLWETSFAEYRDRFGQDPAILDWTAGQNLAIALPGHNIFPAFSTSHSSQGQTLPYIDHSIDLVIIEEGDAVRLEEAGRVADKGVIIITSSPAPRAKTPAPSSSLPLTGQEPEPGGEGEPDGLAQPQEKGNGNSFQIRWRSEEAATTGTRLPSVSIIIPTYNRADLLNSCLEQLLKTLPFWLTVEIIVVDDASSDATGQVLASWAARDSRIKGRPNSHNIGFLHSCNLGATAAKGEVLVFLNNDTLPQNGWLSPLLHTLVSDPQAGAVGGKLLYPNGVLQEAGGIIFEDAEGWNFGRGSCDPESPLYNYFREVDYCSGALLATRRTLFEEVGGFDTRFAPMYYEDVDFCFTLRQKGYKVYYQPECRVIHLEGGTAGTDISHGFKVWQGINRNKFIEKWGKTLKQQPPHPKELNYKIALDLAVRDGEINPA